MLLSSGLISLPSWANSWHVDTLGSNSIFSVAEKDLLAAVVDTIIPKGESLGALSVGVDKFLEKLFADCYDEPTQNNIKKQLGYLEVQAQTTYGKSFASTDKSQREDLLLKMSVGEPDKKDFFTLIKSETIRGFSTSKEVMGDRLKYKVIPGHYNGCLDVNT